MKTELNRMKFESELELPKKRRPDMETNETQSCDIRDSKTEKAVKIQPHNGD